MFGVTHNRSFTVTSLICILIGFIHTELFAQTEWQWTDAANDNESVSLLLMGDTNIQNRKNPGEVYQYVLPTLKAADLRFTNLEGPFAGTSKDPRIPDIPHKQEWKHSEPEMVQAYPLCQFGEIK